MSNLDKELGLWLVERRPGLAHCSLQDTADAIVALTSTLGCLLATVKAQSGPEIYSQTLHNINFRADQTAQQTYQSALRKKAARAKAN